MTGKLGPVIAEAKVILRDTIIATEDWTSPMPKELKSRWIVQFKLWDQLRGLKFNRAVMPDDAVESKLHMIVNCDAGNKMLVVGCWSRFRKKSAHSL
jgi:hypothetical protein